MADRVPAGSDVSAGTYRCSRCEYQLQVASTQHLQRTPATYTSDKILRRRGQMDTVFTRRVLGSAGNGSPLTGQQLVCIQG